VKNRSVLVTGCGPVGLLCIGIAKAYQAKSIIAVDIKESSLVLAKTMGADIVINASTQDVSTEAGFR